MATYPNRFVPMTTRGYPMLVKNDEIFGILVENGSLYNKVRIKLIENLEGNHSNVFKAIPISFGVRKFVAMNLDVKVLVNLISIRSFHNVVIIKIIPLNPRGDPLNIMKKSCSLQLGYLIVTLLYWTFLVVI